MAEFLSRCPNCLSSNHIEYLLRIGPMGLEAHSVHVSPYGPSFRHCEECGLKFPLTSSVELREMEPVEPELGDRCYV